MFEDFFGGIWWVDGMVVLVSYVWIIKGVSEMKLGCLIENEDEVSR